MDIELNEADKSIDTIESIEIPPTRAEKIEEMFEAKERMHNKKAHIAKKYTEIASAVKSWVGQYGKRVGMGAVAAALVAVCGVSLAQREAQQDQATGVMITVADLTADREAFAGNVFPDTAISYTDMSNLTYETDQLAQLERAEKQIDEILSAERQSKRDQAALAALTATHTVVEEDVGEYDPDAVVVASVDTTTEAADTSTAATTTAAVTPVYADANGQYQYLGEYLLTAYCPCPICCGKYSNMTNPVTASGTTPAAGRTIAAPSNFAFGTKIMIDGVIYTVEDRGGAINGNHFDIYFNTHQEALNFGMRTTAAYLVVE